MATVQMPDGTLVDMPDNPTPEQLASLKQIAAGTPAPAPSPGLLESVGRKLVEGYGKTAGSLIYGIPAAIALGTNKLGEMLDFRGHTPEQKAAVDRNRGYNSAAAGAGLLQSMSQEQKPYEQIGASSTIQGLPGSFLEGVGGAATMGVNPTGLLMGGMGNLGAEVAGRLGEGGPLSRVAGALAGGVAGGAGVGVAKRLASTLSPNATNIAKEMVEGITPEMLAKAQAFQAKAAAGGAPGGVNIDLAQALEATGAPAGNVTAVRNFLAGRRQGDATQATLREQPGQLSVAADLFAGSAPGENFGTQVAANDLQKAATGTVNAAKADRSAAVRPLYEQAGELNDRVRQNMQVAIGDAMGQPGLTPAAKSAMEDTLATLRNSPSTDAPMTHALDFDTTISTLSGKFKGTPLTPVDPKSAGQVKNLAGKLNDILQAASPELKQAETRFGQISQDVIDPLKQGPVGQFATPRGYLPDTQAAMTKFSALMQRGTDPAAKVSEIRVLGQSLAKTNPEAVPNAVKSYISMQIKKSIEPGVDAATAANNPDMAARIAQNLFANEAQFQGLKDALSVSAKGLGQDPADVISGLNHLRQLTKALQSRPQGVGGLSSVDLGQVGGANKLADAARVFSFMPAERLARRIEDMTLGKTLTQLDTIMTSPEGADMLAKLAKIPRGSNKAYDVLAGFGGGTQLNPRGLSANNPPQ